MRYINELREGEMVSETYLCKRKETLKTKAGKSYYSMLLQDKTGTLDTKVWELNNGIENFDVLDYIHVDGQITSFQSSLQMTVKRIRKSQEGEYDPVDFMPVTDNDVEHMYVQLLKYIGQIKEPFTKKLVESFFVEDKVFIKKFKNHSAAKSVHHGFIGGLLEHTLGVVKFCNYMVENYEILNYDLLIASALFHDIGKTEELSSFPENDYTDDGQLLGHLYIGAEMVGERINTITGFPPRISREIRHCILAHHGELEYGSPKKPALAEAMALNFADNADARMQTLKEIFHAADDRADWLGYNKLFESNIRRSTRL